MNDKSDVLFHDKTNSIQKEICFKHFLKIKEGDGGKISEEGARREKS